MTNLKLKDNNYRHGNCVPFILINEKTKTVTYKGSLKEIANKLKITPQYASCIGQKNTLFKGKYRIKRVAFSTLMEVI